LNPSFETFRGMAAQGNLAPVWKSYVADLETPVSAYLKLAVGRDYSFLLESVEGGERLGRYTYLGVDPFLRVTARGDQVEIIRDGQVESRQGNVIDILRDLTGGFHPVHVEGLPPFLAGAVGYAGFDIVRLIEPRVPAARMTDVDAPDAEFLFFTNLKRMIYLIANVRLDEHQDLEAAYRQAGEQIAEIEKALGQPTPVPPHAASSGPVEVRSNMTRQQHREAVEKAKEYILAGDIFQVVLSQRLEMDLPAPPFQIYRALRAVNPSPYLFYLKLGENVVLGSSPEMLVKVEGRDVEYRPIAGTRKRGATEAEDRALAADLLADEKELAEHVMLVDLGRNDVGRVSEYGSVRVPEFQRIEYYSHVMHIVSGVRGRLREDKDAFDTLKACFPAGTVSGAPKVRAMEIIAELEPTKRGVYSGSVMYLDFSGNLNSCIAIRTMFVQGNKAYLQVGGGIVADSQPDNEWDETMNKAGALLRAVDLAREL
jgi:anthranilate synthase component I